LPPCVNECACEGADTGTSSSHATELFVVAGIMTAGTGAVEMAAAPPEVGVRGAKPNPLDITVAAGGGLKTNPPLLLDAAGAATKLVEMALEVPEAKPPAAAAVLAPPPKLNPLEEIPPAAELTPPVVLVFAVVSEVEDAAVAAVPVPPPKLNPAEDMPEAGPATPTPDGAPDTGADTACGFSPPHAAHFAASFAFDTLHTAHFH
jgi:hypothetical protein